MTSPGGGYNLGTVRGSVSINVASAIASYAAVRRANAATNTALLESGRSFTRVGLGLTAVGVAALAGFGVAVKAAADFQKQLSFFGAVTDSNKKDMEGVRQKALQLGRDSAFGASEVVNSFVELGKAGVTARDIIAGVGDAVVTLAAAGDIPLKESSDTIVNAMKTYQIAAKDSVKIANVLAGTANASTVDITDLAFSLKYVGGTAAALNISLEDTLNALGQLGNAGIRGSTGGTALRKILLSLSPVSAKSADELKKLGIITTNGGVSAAKYAKLQDKQKAAVDNLRKAQERLVDVQRIAAARASDKSSAGTSAKQIEAAQTRAAAAARRLADAQAHLQDVQQKLAATPLGDTAAKQASRFSQLEAAQRRVAAAEQHVADVRKKNASVAAGGTGGSAAAVRAQIELRNAQEAVATAGDKVRATGVPLAKGTEKLTNLFFDQHGKAKPLAEIFQILQDHMKGLTQQQKVQAAETIFGNRAISSALILTRQGAKGFKDFGAQINQVTALEVMNKRLDNLSGAWRIFKSSVQTALIQVGTPAQKPLQVLVQMLTKVVNAFARLPSWVQQGIAGFIVFFGLIATSLGIFILFVGFMAKAVRAFQEFKAALAFVKELQLFTRAMVGLDVVLAANPIVLIALAVIALGVAFVLLYRHSETFRKGLRAIGSALKGAFEATVNWFKGIPKFFERVWKDIKGVFSAGLDWLKKNWDLLLPIFFGPIGLVILIWKRFGGTIFRIAKEVFHTVVNFFEALPGEAARGVVSAFTAFDKFMAALPNRVAFAIGFIIGRTIRFGIDIAKAGYAAGKALYHAVVNWFEALPGRVEHFVSMVKDRVVAGAKLWWSQTSAWVARLYHDVVNFFRRLPGDIAHWLSVFKDREVQGWKNIYHAAVHWAEAAYHAVLNFFKDLPGHIWGFLVAAWHKFDDTSDAIRTAAENWISGVESTIGKFFTDLPGRVLQALKDAVTGIKNAGKDAFNAMKGWGNSLWSGFKKGLFGSPRTKVEYALEAMTDTGDREVKKLRRQILAIQGLSQKLPTQGTFGGVQAAGGLGTTNTTHSTTHKTTNINISNPVAEKSSDTLPRVLRAIEFVGA